MHTHTHTNSHQPSLVFRFVSAAWVLLPALRFSVVHCVVCHSVGKGFTYALRD